MLGSGPVAAEKGRDPTRPDPAGGREVSSRGFVGSAIRIALLTLTSRVTGLGRDAGLAAWLGTTPVADAFFLGFSVPNLFRRLFGEGALTAAFVPVYAKEQLQSPANARALARKIATRLFFGLVVIVALGEAALFGLRSWTGPDHHQAISMVAWMLPFLPFICTTALYGAILQVHDRFAPAATVPIVLNLVLIATGSIVALGTDSPSRIALALAIAVVGAGVLQFIGLRMLVARFAGGSTADADAVVVSDRTRGIAIALLPAVLGMAIFQLNTFLDSVIAYVFAAPPGELISMLGMEFDAPVDPGGVACLQYSQRLQQFPLGVFAIALSTALFPAMSRAAVQDVSELRRLVVRGLRLSAFIAVPSAIGLALVRTPLVSVIYERGAFTEGARVSGVLLAHSIAVVPYALQHVLTRSLHAVGDLKTPVRIGMVVVAVNAISNVVLIFPLGVAGLAWSSAMTSLLHLGLSSYVVFRRRLPRRPTSQGDSDPAGPSAESSLIAVSKIIAATALMALGVGFVVGRIENDLVALAVGTGLGVVLYGGAAMGMRCREWDWLRTRKVD